MSAPAVVTVPRRGWAGMSLTARILAGLGFGIALGLFFGEDVRILQGLASAYIGLMQMTVLPYLVVALVLGLGRLSAAQALLLARYGGLTLLVFWVLTLAVVGLMPVVFPTYESAFFFSTSLIEPRQPLSFVDLYIPSNPFHSLANNVVPAVTLFSAALGVALIGVPDKERFLGPLDALMQALGKVTHFVVALTPLGVIPIAALAAGTLQPDDLVRLEVYFVSFLVAAILLGLVLLPALVACVTPVRYRELLGASSDALLTAFVTSNVFIVLPMLAEHCDRLVARHASAATGGSAVPEVVVPIAFNFPTAGKLLTLLFVPFAAWLAGSPLAAGEFPGLLVTGLFSYFAKAQVALPFLMDLVKVPQDLFQLYIPTTILNGKLDSAVGAMSLFAFSVITAMAMAGRLRLGVANVLRFLAVAGLSTAVALIATALALSWLVDARYTKADALKAMHLSRTQSPAVVVDPGSPRGETGGSRPLAPLERVLRGRGSLRVGFSPERMPFTFFNLQGELVGFDVEMLSRLGEDLGVRVEYVPVRLDEIDIALQAGIVDLVPSIVHTHHWIRRVRLSEPYMEGTIGLLVRDARRDEFASAEAIARHQSLLVGVPGDADLYSDYLSQLLGDVPYTLVELESWDHYFDGGHGELDAVIGMAEVATAWSLLHPEYSVVIPAGTVIRRPLAFAMPPDAAELALVIDEWVRLQQARGEVERAYQYWILGKGAETRSRRWSIARDVLGWID